MAGSETRSPNTKAQREFVSEAEEILDRLRSDIGDLLDQRTNLGDNGEVDPDLVNQVFRSAHSLKGLAGMFGLDAMSELSHHLEDLLDGLRLGRTAIDSPAVDLLDEAVSLLVRLLENTSETGREEESRQLVDEMIERIEAAVTDAPEPVDDLGGLALDPALLRALTEYEEHRLRENIRRGRHLCLVDTTFEILAFEEGLAELSSAVREVGEVVSTLPSPGDAPESQIRFSLLVATQIPVDNLRARLEFPDTSVHSVREAPQPRAEPQSEGGSAGRFAAPVHTPTPSSPTDPVPGVAEARGPDAPGGDGGDIESLRSISDTVRVDIRKLDELMNLVGELVIQRAAVEQIATRLAGDPATARVGGELAKTHKLLERKLKELQSGVLDVRMVPLRQVFEKLSRVVRRLRRDLGKDVVLEFKGGDTELDKLIVEQLIDPLMHVVRNAIDHAIESEAERSAVGKPSQGRIFIEASQRGNYVLIEVHDDGRGIEAAEVRALAESMNLADPDDVLSDKEILDFLFLPGFSTRTEVSETSGRGVGMDVVRANLTAVGGIVDLSSDPGRGTTVTLTLPVTLAIIRALLVRVGDQRYAIPLNSVLETLLVDTSEIQRSEGREILNLRGQPLILRRLSEEFGLAPAEDLSKQYVVVLGLGELRVGLLVDRLAGQQDTVIKPILGPIRQVRGVAGATEIGDQGAVLVLDVSTLVEDALRRREAA